MFVKLGENLEITRIENPESCIPSVSQDVLDQFKKTAAALKKIAPKAEDFLYFSAVMMHAAEAAALNEDGTIKLNVKGEPVQVGWDKTGGTWRWTSNDPNIKPYKNSNGDIFPEEELVKAYKKWVHKPLCIDHKSSSVDHVRGFIVDTYYDRNLKRVIALCALDKHNYPDLARKVSTGYSTSVSMGTAVGRAICSDCAKVAKAEPDFCDHMRRKSCYGEINIDLNPIELSIVVNGADPKAHIKHIIAAANTLNSYVENKYIEMNKAAEKVYNASISVSDEDHENKEHYGISGSITANDYESFKSQLKELQEKLEKFEKKSSEDTNDVAYNQSSGSVEMGESATDVVHSQLAPPHARFAAAQIEEDSINELRKVTASIEAKLNLMKDSLNKLAKNSTNKQEENMSNEMNKRAYYQGAGGVNEPTPGQAKYTKDPMNEDLRLTGDKQMVGQMDTGPVDGMHPGPESVGMSELDRKKMLARAEAEDRAMRRNAIVNLAKQALEDKKAYYHGGGGVNEPTPGKPKYTVDPLNEEARKEDKQMVGQKPFPGVGDVEGLHPSPASVEESDELKRKQMLSRAGLRARFIKAANLDGTQNLGSSAWQVFQGDKLVLAASVNDLSGGNAGMLYDSIATKEFGSRLIEKIKAFGADGVRALVKRAQEAAAAPAPAAAPAAAPAPAAPVAAEPAMPEAPVEEAAEVEDTGKTGDAKETALDLAEKVRDLSSDLLEAVRALTGEKAEMGKMEEVEEAPEMGATASFSLSTLNSLRRELNGQLTGAMKEAVANLNDHHDELNMIAKMYARGSVNASNAEFVDSIVEDAFGEAKTSIADGFKLMTAFVKYARGTKAVVKRAAMESQLKSLAQEEDDYVVSGGFFEEAPEFSAEMSAADDSDLMNLLDEDLADVKEMLHADFEDETSDGDEEDESAADDEGVVTVDTADAATKVLQSNPKAKVTLESKASRAAFRAKLAADALGTQDDGELHDMSKFEFSDVLEQASDLTDGDTKLDVKPSDELGRVETLVERNKKMMDVATAPPKVRKEAEAIHRLISEGKLDSSDLDALVAEGLDKDAVDYYKKYYGQVDGGSQFASELVKEHVKAQMEEELNGYRVKMARAYELAYDMVDRGLCLNDRSAISAQVDEIMKFNDESFSSLKRVVAQHSPVLHKQAGRMPQVGIIGSGESSVSVEDDWSQLSAAFSKSAKRMF